jgi:hypothetical protein
MEAYAQALGGLAEWDAEDDLQLLDPVSGKLRLLVFDPDGLTERPEAELVAPGSAALEELLTRARSCGRLSLACLEVPAVPDRLVQASVIRTLRVPDAAIQIAQLRWAAAEYAVFLFRVAFVSDVREEELLEVVVDRSTGRLIRRWDELQAAGRLSEGPSHDPLLPALSVRATYEMARAEVLRNLTAPITQRQRNLIAWKQREAIRLTRYHEELDEELAERAQKEHRDTRRQALLARLDANRLEAQRAAQDLETRYALSVELECASLLLIRVPKALLTCRMENLEQSWQAEVDIMWNAASRAAEPVDCPGCGQPEFEFRLQREGLTCPHCPKPVRVR